MELTITCPPCSPAGSGKMILLLAPFEELTQQISSSTASAGDVIPSIRALTHLLEKTAETDHGVKTSKATLLEAVQK